MITDVLTQFSGGYASGVATGQTVTGTDTTVLSTNTYDLGVARDLQTAPAVVQQGRYAEAEPLFRKAIAFATFRGFRTRFDSTRASRTNNCTRNGTCSRSDAKHTTERGFFRDRCGALVATLQPIFESLSSSASGCASLNSPSGFFSDFTGSHQQKLSRRERYSGFAPIATAFLIAVSILAAAI